VATNGATNSGLGKPILAKRPAPTLSGRRNFWIPSERKTAPTIRRIRMTAAGAEVDRIGRRIDAIAMGSALLESG
jgi:hypothetical protein